MYCNKLWTLNLQQLNCTRVHNPLQGGLCHISALLLRGAVSGQPAEEFHSLFWGPLDDAMPNIQDMMPHTSISYTLFHCFSDHILSAKQDHWINITLQMQYLNGMLMSSSFKRETQTDTILSTCTTNPSALHQFWTKRKEQTYKRCFPTNRAQLKLGSPCSQCQTCALQSFGQESLCSSVHQGSHITWRTALSPNNDLAWCISVAQSRPTTTS